MSRTDWLATEIARLSGEIQRLENDADTLDEQRRAMVDELDRLRAADEVA